MESSNFQRGIQLFELGRYSEALSYFSEDMDHWENRYFMAQSHYMLNDYNKAEELANTLLEESPDSSAVFFLKARLAAQKDKPKDALKHINEALSFDPYDDDFFGFRAAILLQLKKYEQGLVSANEGLSINPTNSFCLNIRAQLLTKLERVEEADQTVENILFENPEDAYSHANVGWVALENNKIDKALNHFKEALQHNPNFDYAREGMTKALKAKNFVYRSFLKYAFWIAKKSAKSQFAFIIGIYLVYRFSYKILDANDMTYLAIPLFIAYLLFALGSWIIEPMSNGILSFNNYGKYLLSQDEKFSGYSFIGLAVGGLISIALFYLQGSPYFLPLGAACLAALVPLPKAFLRSGIKGRYLGFGVGVLILLVGSLGMLFTQDYYLLIAIVVGIMAIYTWVGNIFD